MTNTGSAEHDVIIIGGGQAGLAMGHALTARGVEVVILDAATHIGQRWADRWDSLTLFTPARYSALPGLPFPGDPWHHPTKNEVAAYLSDYAHRFALPVRSNTEVVRLQHLDGCFTTTLDDGEQLTARRVVVATGAFGSPQVPALSNEIPPTIQQIHSDHYRRPTDLPDGPILVVGSGNSGRQIALELAISGAQVHLAQGTATPTLPQRFLGRDIFWWLEHTGLLRTPATSTLGRRLRSRNDVVIGTSRNDLRRAGVMLRPRAVTFAGSAITFADATTATPVGIVWATGYRHDDRWIDIPPATTDGQLANTAGVTPISGLYSIGRPWQYSRGSSLLGSVGSDAQRLAARMLDERPEPRRLRLR